MDIFISYRQDGSRGWAAYLHQLLDDSFEPGHVFLDNVELHSGDWQEQLDAALAQCKVFMLIIGPQWLQAADSEGQRRLLDPADVHRGEIETVLARGKNVTVIPLLVDGARMPAQRDLPASIVQLASRQALELPGSGWRGAGSRNRLLDEISRATGRSIRKTVAWRAAAMTVIAVLIATLISSIAAVVIGQVVFGATLTQPEVSVLMLVLLGAWSALAWWRHRRALQPPVQDYA